MAQQSPVNQGSCIVEASRSRLVYKHYIR